MPVATPGLAVIPPTCTLTVVVASVLASSDAYSLTTFNLSPWNLAGQWHCSHVSIAGLRSVTGAGIGREYVLKVTANTCLVPDSFDFTNHDAPAPMWHCTQVTRECGPS
jgi:hypothetical protein